MPPPGGVVLEIRQLRKSYGALRPLRIEHLDVSEAEAVALVGFDRPAAQVLVDLLTGATLPDSGAVRLFGQSTRDVTDGDAWLASLDRIGIFSERAVLLDSLTVQQNLAVPFSLDLDPIPPDVQARVVLLAREVGLTEDDLPRPASEMSHDARLRLRLGRAAALEPRILFAEHPDAMAPEESVARFAEAFTGFVACRQLTTVTLTADRVFAGRVASRVLTLQPATGQLVGESAWRGWLGRR